MSASGTTSRSKPAERGRSPRFHRFRGIACLGSWLLFSACFLLEPDDGFRDTYSRHSFDDLFVVADAVLDREYRIEVADRETGRIETAWSRPLPERGGRLLRRRRALVALSQFPGEVRLGVRVATQIQRTDAESPNWLHARDDNAAAARLSQEIRMFLDGSRLEDVP